MKNKKLKKSNKRKDFKTLWPIVWMRFNFLQATDRSSWYSFDQTQEGERQSQPWGHPVVLNPGSFFKFVMGGGGRRPNGGRSNMMYNSVCVCVCVCVCVFVHVWICTYMCV